MGQVLGLMVGEHRLGQTNWPVAPFWDPEHLCLWDMMLGALSSVSKDMTPPRPRGISTWLPGIHSTG
jgi:hypothetical protein